ncbi:MAG: nitroreductase family protein [Nitrospinota bacterium]|nr:nitroreductase family protein [Nitrospinota bacterium]
MDENSKQFYDTLVSRSSVRVYQDREIEEEKIALLLETLRLSQSAANRQPWHFILLKKGEERKGFEELLHRETFKKAPLILVACADPDSGWERKYDGERYAVVDVTIAVTDMIAVANSLGLGTCWIASFDPPRLKEVLGIPDNIVPVGIITIGYSDESEEKGETVRKSLKEIIHYDRW